MLFLSENEINNWKKLSIEIIARKMLPFNVYNEIRKGLIPAFHFYIGSLFFADENYKIGELWVKEGINGEERGLFMNSLMTSYLQRNNHKLTIPEVIFADAAPYVHFASVPAMKESRSKFIEQCCYSLPTFKKPLKIVDLGSGHGELLINLIKQLKSKNIVNEVDEILFIDSSIAMLDIAEENAKKEFKYIKIKKICAKIQDVIGNLENNYDIALSSLAYHHMPFEDKMMHMKELSGKIDHFLLYEIDANNDTPEQNTPEMALSVYQSYGSLIDFLFSHDAPVETAIASIDKFLMSETVSFITQKRGERTDYHMLKDQWHELFRKGLGNDYECLCDSITYGDENINLFTLHYGRL